MARKTIEIASVVQQANDVLLHTPDDDINGRTAMIGFIENLLLGTKNYKGFKYLDSTMMTESANGTTVGIRNTEIHDDRFVLTDFSRVRYF